MMLTKAKRVRERPREMLTASHHRTPSQNPEESLWQQGDIIMVNMAGNEERTSFTKSKIQKINGSLCSAGAKTLAGHETRGATARPIKLKGDVTCQHSKPSY
jgi:hypothetical protein